MRVAVVGHVEWVELLDVAHVPRPGEIVEAHGSCELPAGSGAVAAVQIARLAGECLFLTALGDDERGHRAAEALGGMGVRVEAAWRPAAQRHGLVQLDSGGERTLTLAGERLAPRGTDPLPWAELADVDAVYFTAGDAAAVRAARAAGKLVATVRALPPLREAGSEVDVLLASADDDAERYCPGDLGPEPRLLARTRGGSGGSLTYADGRGGAWEAAPPPGKVVDSYGAGDSFAGGLTYGLASGRDDAGALELAARCGAACVSGRGPYEGQLRSPE